MKFYNINLWIIKNKESGLFLRKNLSGYTKNMKNAAIFFSRECARRVTYYPWEKVEKIASF